MMFIYNEDQVFIKLLFHKIIENVDSSLWIIIANGVIDKRLNEGEFNR